MNLCGKCNVELEVTLWKAKIPMMWQRKRECPQCHGRIFSMVSEADAAPTSNTNHEGEAWDRGEKSINGKNLQCDCCKGYSDKIFAVDTKDWDFVCGSCRDQINEAKETMKLFNARLME